MTWSLVVVFFAFVICYAVTAAVEEHKVDDPPFDWSSWWSYDGISGPRFWGIINRRWRLCSDGRRQSPVDLTTASVIFDHTLPQLQLEPHKIDGTLVNTGFGVRWSVGTEQVWQMSGGPLHYSHTLAHAVLRWSNEANTKDAVGSEHSIQGNFYPGEVQLYLFNSDLYKNFTQALDKPNGILGVSILLKIGWRPNPVLKIWMDHIHMVPHRGKSTWIPFLPVKELFTSPLFLTYDGSLTEPPCEETVTWIVLNKPAYITADQLWQLQSLRRGTHGQALPITGNFRPLQPLNTRVIRTNIPPYSLTCSGLNRTNLYQAMDMEMT